ncbi:MAG: protease [Candidatus Parcubacteria bacterium]|jgi:protease-4|nr:protease [Candidatus Parcubacteria bacterium]
MDFIRHHLLAIAAVAVVLLITFFIALRVWGSWYDEWSGYNAENSVSDGVCNIAVVRVEGDIVSFASENERPQYTMAIGDDVVGFISRAEADWGIEGVLVQIDSYGGIMSAASEVTDRIQALTIPNAAYIREAGASAAYLIASGADTIVTTPFADVGSIGVTMSYVEQTRQNEDTGLDFVPLSSGKYKDYGNPNRELTDEERSLFERDLEMFHKAFVSRIAANRNLSVEEVSALADGSSVPGELALEKKLVDAVGNKETVRTWFAEQLDIPVEEVIFCE